MKNTIKQGSSYFASILLGAALSCPSLAQTDNQQDSANKAIEEITVYGSSPLTANLSENNSPYSVQNFSAEDFKSNSANSIADILNRQANGVTINHAQNNPLQPDLQVRGFSASPLLGAPQGVAVYLNGSRINEPFGDTVNWDLIAPSILDSMSLISGANASYGLNALGASLVLNSKTGFDYPTTALEISAGAFGRQQASLSKGDHNNNWAYFFDLSQFKEDGWRDFSPTEANNAYGAISFRDDSFEWDLFSFWTDSELRGNGAAPEDLIAQDREAVFTHPDITENNLLMLSSRQLWNFDQASDLSLNIVYRENQTDSFNGDGSEFEECDPPFDSFLCDDDDPTELIEDQAGNPVSNIYDAINNISERQQKSVGATLEYRLQSLWANVDHHQTFGLDLYSSETQFESEVEFAQLRANRSTTQTGLFNEEGETQLDASVDSYSFYWLDKINLSDLITLSLSLRYNHLEVKTDDKSGAAPELNAQHTYAGLNGGFGLVYQLSESTNLFANLHQSSRAPSPVELACSHVDAPCTLPNTFLADPPLDEVVARNFELGIRQFFSGSEDSLFWSANTFLTRINDDIIFQTTGGVSSNEGFFSNASDTQRLGISASLGGDKDKFEWQLSYTWLQATYEDNFVVSSPNHPQAVNDQIAVTRGDEIPGLAENNLSASIRWKFHTQWNWEWDAQYQSGVYLRGDEGNLDSQTDGFLLVNTQLNVETSPALSMYLSINNVFDTEYETFGLYGEPDEVIPSLGDENTRFVSPSEPRGAWLGLRYEF